MQVILEQSFLKSAQKLSEHIKKKLSRLLGLLETDPYHSLLHTKKLSGDLADYLCFRITRDWRVIFVSKATIQSGSWKSTTVRTFTVNHAAFYPPAKFRLNVSRFRLELGEDLSQGLNDLIALDAVSSKLHDQSKLLAGWNEAKNRAARFLLRVSFLARLVARHHAQSEPPDQIPHLGVVRLPRHLKQLGF